MIHQTALIDPSAKIGSHVNIGAYSIIGAEVVIGDGCSLDSHVWIGAGTQMGQKNKIGFGSHIGGDPQDGSFDTLIQSRVRIGRSNIIREHVTIHRSTSEGGETVIGNHNMLMINSHLAHDVIMGNHNNLANGVLIAGHITIGDYVFLGGGAGFHQFIKIGDYVVCQGNAAITKDIPPYCMAHGQNNLAGLNVIGLKRAKFNVELRKEIKELYNHLFKRTKPLDEILLELEKREWSQEGQKMVQAVKTPSRKGILLRSL